MEKVTQTMGFEICRTGSLGQYYTLYIETLRCCGGVAFNNRQFVQNLAIDEKEAHAKGREIMEDTKRRLNPHIPELRCFFDFLEVPKKEYSVINAFGFEWKKSPKGYTTYPTEEFWEIWRSHKSSLKEAGFSVFKNDRTYQFVLFLRNDTEENLIKSLQTMQHNMDSQVIVGEFQGEIGSRLKGLDITIDSKRMMYEDTVQKVGFTDGEGNKYCTTYGGRHEFTVGDKVTVNATVKNHQNHDGQRTTIVTRLMVPK